MIPSFLIPKYALTEMSVSRTPMPDAPSLVLIEGRKPGIMGLLLTLLRLEPVCKLKVSENEILVHKTSLFGQTHQVIPINRVASASFGVIRPLWQLAAAIICFVAGCVFLLTGAASITALILLVVSAIFFVSYYIGKSAVIFIESTGGGWQALGFKGALIGGKRVDEQKAQAAVLVIRDIILASERFLGSRSTSPVSKDETSPRAQAPASVGVLLECSSCGHTQRIAAKYAGKRIKCPKCACTVQVSDV